MAYYRAYTVGLNGHFIGYEPLVCTDDYEAIERTKLLVDGSDIELWHGGRFVKRLAAAESLGGDAVTHEIKDGRMVPKK